MTSLQARIELWALLQELKLSLSDSYISFILEWRAYAIFLANLPILHTTNFTNEKSFLISVEIIYEAFDVEREAKSLK